MRKMLIIITVFCGIFCALFLFSFGFFGSGNIKYFRISLIVFTVLGIFLIYSKRNN